MSRASYYGNPDADLDPDADSDTGDTSAPSQPFLKSKESVARVVDRTSTMTDVTPHVTPADEEQARCVRDVWH